MKKYVSRQVTGLCDARCIKRHNEITSFLLGMPNIINALTEITLWKDCQTFGKAKILVTTLCDNELIIAIFSLTYLLCHTYPLSKIFQQKN